MNNDCNKRSSSEELGQAKRSTAVIESLVSGSISSASTTVIYQPLELLKTRIQLRDQQTSSNSTSKVIGRTTRSATRLIRDHSIGYLWRGTGAVSILLNIFIHWPHRYLSNKITTVTYTISTRSRPLLCLIKFLADQLIRAR